MAANDLDRHIHSLILQQDFPYVKGIVLGRFQVESKITPDLVRIIVESKPELKEMPIIAEADFGHTLPMFTFPIGGEVELESRESGITLKLKKNNLFWGTSDDCRILILSEFYTVNNEGVKKSWEKAIQSKVRSVPSNWRFDFRHLGLCPKCLFYFWHTLGTLHHNIRQKDAMQTAWIADCSAVAKVIPDLYVPA